jgi:guanylate kinase
MGPLIIISGPSGSGKSTLIHRAIAAVGPERSRLAVSATTRSKRPGERDGVDYHFWTREKFERELAAGAFLEHAMVHGQQYGTPRDEVDRYRERGMGVILDVDVQGAASVRRLYPEHLSIFVKLPTWEMYEQRLRGRSEPEASIARRLLTAREELKHERDYQHVVVNGDLEQAVAELTALIARAF